MKQLVTIFICTGLIMLSISSAQARTRIFTEEYTYTASHLDNEFSSRVIARAEVRTLLLSRMAEITGNKLKAGGYPVTPSYNIALLSCLTRLIPVKEEWDDGRFYYKARVKTNIDTVLTDFGTLYATKHPTGDIVANRETSTATLGEIKRSRAASAASSGNRKAVQDKYNRAVNRLHATDWFEVARFSGFTQEFDKAIDAYTKAIEYDPELAAAYHNRGTFYLTFKKDRQLGAADLLKANQLYNSKAAEQLRAGNYAECVGYLHGAIATKPNDAGAFFQRAYCNVGLKQQDDAKEDFVAAARLGHEEAQRLLSSKNIKW